MKEDAKRSFKKPSKFQEERLRRHWSQQDLADKLGTTRVTVSRWETGQTFPSAYYLQQLSEILGKSMAELEVLLGIEQEQSDPPGDERQVLPQEAPLSSLVNEPQSASNKDRAPSRQEASTTRGLSTILRGTWSRRAVVVGAGLALTSVVAGWTVETVLSKVPVPKVPVQFLRQLVDGRATSINNLAWSRNQAYLATATGSDGLVVFFDTRQGVFYSENYTQVSSLASIWINDVDWHKQKSLVVAALAGENSIGGLYVWSFPNQLSQLSFATPYSLRTVAWSPVGELLAYGGHSTTVTIYDYSSRQWVRDCKGHGPIGVNRVKWSPDGKYIASAGDDQTVRIWEASTGANLLTYHGHQQKVYDLDWSPRGDRIVSASEDSTIQVWDTSDARTLHICKGHRAPVHCVSWSPDGRFLASGSADTTARIWHADSGAYYAVCGKHPGVVQGIAWSPDSSIVAVGYGSLSSQDGGVELWTVPGF